MSLKNSSASVEAASNPSRTCVCVHQCVCACLCVPVRVCVCKCQRVCVCLSAEAASPPPRTLLIVCVCTRATCVRACVRACVHACVAINLAQLALEFVDASTRGCKLALQLQYPSTSARRLSLLSLTETLHISQLPSQRRDFLHVVEVRLCPLLWCDVCARVNVCACMCVCVCVRARGRARVCASMYACVCGCVHVSPYTSTTAAALRHQPPRLRLLPSSPFPPHQNLNHSSWS